MPTLGEIRAMAKRAKAPLYGGDSKLVYPVTPERALYNEVLNTFADAPDDLAILDGTIRSEAQLSTALGTQAIILNVRSDQQNPTNAIRTTEKRLDIRDAFVADRITIMVGDELTASTAPGTTMLQSFPNSLAVAAAATAPGGFGANSPGVREIYNGTLSALINSVQYMQDLDCLNFVYADTAQANELIFTASNTPWGAQRGDNNFKRLTPALNMWGSDKVQFQVNMPDAFTFSAEANHRVVVALIIRGLRVQGGAAYKN